MIDTRTNTNNQQNGVITVMLRDAAITASQNPSELESLEINVLENDEVLVKRKK